MNDQVKRTFDGRAVDTAVATVRSLSAMADELERLRAESGRMRRVCDAVARALGDDGARRYTVDEIAEALARRLMPVGYEWPRFEDGEPVSPGDLANCGCSTPIEVDGFELAVRIGGESYWSVEGIRDDHGTPQREWIKLAPGERVRRPGKLPSTSQSGSIGNADKDDACHDGGFGVTDSWGRWRINCSMSGGLYCRERGIGYTNEQDACVKKGLDLERRAKALAGVGA